MSYFLGHGTHNWYQKVEKIGPKSKHAPLGVTKKPQPGSKVLQCRTNSLLSFYSLWEGCHYAELWVWVLLSFLGPKVPENGTKGPKYGPYRDQMFVFLRISVLSVPKKQTNPGLMFGSVHHTLDDCVFRSVVGHLAGTMTPSNLIYRQITVNYRQLPSCTVDTV